MNQILKPSSFARTVLLNNRTGVLIGNKGQSLAEILIAVGIIAIVVGGVVGAIVVSLQILSQNKYIQNATFLAQELLNNVTVVGESDWHKIDRFGADALDSTPAKYRVISSEPFSVASGSEVITLDGVDYERYFTLDWVSRDGGENIEDIYDSAKEDPSTIKITSIISWAAGGSAKLVKYLTRGNNTSSLQTDWSGGGGQSGSFADPIKYDAAVGGIDVASQSGSIRLSGVSYP